MIEKETTLVIPYPEEFLNNLMPHISLILRNYPLKNCNHKCIKSPNFLQAKLMDVFRTQDFELPGWGETSFSTSTTNIFGCKI